MRILRLLHLHVSKETITDHHFLVGGWNLGWLEGFDSAWTGTNLREAGPFSDNSKIWSLFFIEF
jgi:hypothetical protein